MGFQQRRRLIKVSKSSGVVLPKPWVDFHGERAKTLVLIGDGVLIVAPEGYEGKARRMLELAETDIAGEPDAEA